MEDVLFQLFMSWQETVALLSCLRVKSVRAGERGSR